MLEGILGLSPLGLVLATLALTHVTIVAVTVYLHRCQAHRALTLHPWVSHFFRFWLWLTTGMVTREWVAVHRRHHVHCETPEDPHSPQVLGLRKVLWQGAEVYSRAAADAETVRRYGGGTPDDWLERHLYSRHRNLGIGLLLGLDLLLFGVAGLAVWAVQMLWIPFWAAGVINGVGHYLGYRNFATEDASTNIVPWGILIGGEELHNNHHAHPASARLSSRWWELDLGWGYIRLLKALGLARVKKLAPRPRLVPKAGVDVETLRAVMRTRFHVMALYGRRVLLPAWREACRRADQGQRRLLRRARRFLLRGDAGAPEAQAVLAPVLGAHGGLRTAYEFKRRLQALWSRSQDANERRLQQLQAWCRQAEASGMESLAQFARMLRGYSLAGA